MVVRVDEDDLDAQILISPLAEEDGAVAAGLDLFARGGEGLVDDVFDGAPAVGAGQGPGVEEGDVGLRVGGAPDEDVGGGEFGFDVGPEGEGAVGMGAGGLACGLGGGRSGGGRTFRGRWWDRCSSIAVGGEHTVVPTRYRCAVRQ